MQDDTDLADMILSQCEEILAIIFIGMAETPDDLKDIIENFGTSLISNIMRKWEGHDGTDLN